jgi:hypothetical protein
MERLLLLILLLLTAACTPEKAPDMPQRPFVGQSFRPPEACLVADTALISAPKPISDMMEYLDCVAREGYAQGNTLLVEPTVFCDPDTLDFSDLETVWTEDEVAACVYYNAVVEAAAGKELSRWYNLNFNFKPTP